MSHDDDERRSDDALDWLMEWANAVDINAPAHYWHIVDGNTNCGCPLARVAEEGTTT